MMDQCGPPPPALIVTSSAAATHMLVLPDACAS